MLQPTCFTNKQNNGQALLVKSCQRGNSQIRSYIDSLMQGIPVHSVGMFAAWAVDLGRDAAV